MDGRDFWRMASLATVSVVGARSGISRLFVQAPLQRVGEQPDKPEDHLCAIESRRLGTLDVSAIGLGCLPMVGYYGGEYDKREMIALICRAYDQGVIFFDTAEVYGPYISEELEIGFVPYSPLGGAFLTGTIDENSRFKPGDRRWNLPQFQPEALKYNMLLVALIRRWAGQMRMTPARFALVWMLSRKAWIALIPGTTRSDHLDDLFGAASVRLTPYEMEAFDREYAMIDLMAAQCRFVYRKLN